MTPAGDPSRPTYLAVENKAISKATVCQTVGRLAFLNANCEMGKCALGPRL
jgi:hypothetical protein